MVVFALNAHDPSPPAALRNPYIRAEHQPDSRTVRPNRWTVRLSLNLTRSPIQVSEPEPLLQGPGDEPLWSPRQHPAYPRVVSIVFASKPVTPKHPTPGARRQPLNFILSIHA